MNISFLMLVCGEHNAVAMANGLTHWQWPVMHPIRAMTMPSSSRATTDATMVPTCSRTQVNLELAPGGNIVLLLLLLLC